MGYAVRITSHAVDVVTGADKSPGIVAAAEATGAGRKTWGGGELRSRAPRHGSDYGGSPYGSYAPTPVSASFGSPLPSASPYAPSFPASPNPATGTPRSASYGLGLGLRLRCSFLLFPLVLGGLSGRRALERLQMRRVSIRVKRSGMDTHRGLVLLLVGLWRGG